ncbi:MAG: hypothetical protein BWX86_02741 [Verrucomicrobia bacterium ADurb.Bin122]|nr:MAG: hypothetical protein BWX86_02741 [Verrucomicrobia bacterium ADurb.Bin122]
MELGHFLSVGLVHEMDGALAGHTFDRAVFSLNDDAAAGNHAAVMAADGGEIEVAAFVDVGEQQAELIHVAGKHDDGVALGVERGEAVAHGVVGVGVGVGLHEAVEHLLCLELVAGWRAGFQQRLEKGRNFVLGGHK